MKNLLLVEDDQSLGQTLTERLEKEGFKVFWGENLADARAALDSQPFDLVILDVGLPDGSGFDFARDMRGEQPIPFIFVTAESSAESRLEGYELGAEEYIPKPFHFKELLMRIRHVLKNHSPLKSLEFDELRIDFDQMLILHPDGRQERLALKDFQVLRLLIERSPAVVSRDEIMDKVWGEEKFPSNRTVDNVILRLRQVLGDKHSHWISSIRGVGYQWKSDEVKNG
ncbi:MAG: response regulator transcription factor [Bdellovibrionales bacterium]|nr:response regulator transcription factor [Bdellovibrionales bacterium]